MEDVILKIVDLHIRAQDQDRCTDIIKGVSLSVRRGEVLGVIGESGAGKSTIGLAALGFVRPGARVTGGTITFDGIELTTASEDTKRKLRGVRMAYVAQSAAAAFNPALRLMDQTIEAAVTRGGQSRSEAEENARELYCALQLPDPANFGSRYPHQVSGGQLQRAMTAMAIMCKPDLIVFDEPTTALDVTTQVSVLKSIRKVIEQSGVAALYITHDLAVVVQMADRIAVLRHGVKLEEGATSSILCKPAHPYTKSLWAVHQIQVSETKSSEPLLQVDGVSAYYSSVRVLSDISLKVGRAETVAVVGESGSGKSTLARVIAGLHQSDPGKIVFDGTLCPPLVGQRPRELLRRIQIIYQSAETALNPHHSIRKIIGRPLEFFHGLSGERRERRLVELLEMVELDARYLERRPRQLSGGQLQRVSIARALAAEPDLIICDEITSALDKAVQAEILRMLMDLQGRLGISYFFITHDIVSVKAIANRVVIMNRGVVVAQGAKEEVLSPPYAPYTERLLSAVPKMDPAWLDNLIISGDLS
jgi:peptide/nickel transport system ATP-binding protein